MTKIRTVTRRALECRVSDRSTNFISPIFGQGCLYKCAYCVVAGTLISTPRGARLVELIKESHEVLSYNTKLNIVQFDTVLKTNIRTVTELVEITLENSTLTLTPEHNVYTSNNIWVEAKELTVSDFLILSDNSKSQIISIKRINKATVVYDLKIKNNENFFANNILIHNCYMRDNKPFGLDIPKNMDDILQSVKNHSDSLAWPKDPDQTHEKYWTYDLSCSEDLALHLKYHDFDTIFDFFVNEPKIMGSFATKFVNKNLLKYNPKGKIRIRFSLMPQEYSTILEPKTSLIIDRIKAINLFIEAGWDVHINLSPIIAKKGSSELYAELFELLNEHVKDKYKPSVKSECIFLTYSKKSYDRNLIENPEANDLCWFPEHQENKNSTYGKNRIRYKWQTKNTLVKLFTDLHKKHIPWSEIRYIF